METKEKIKKTLIESHRVFFLNNKEAKMCIDGRTTRRELIDKKLDPIVDKIINIVKEGLE